MIDGEGGDVAGVGDEFELIARYFAPLSKGAPGAFGLTDDGALLDVSAGARVVAVTDAVVAGVHFLDGDPPGDIARKAVRVNLSDLAAMGAVAKGMLLAAVFPHATDAPWLEAFAAGLAGDVAAFSCPLIGGDTVASDGPLTLAVTALGEVPAKQVLRRAGARAGDAIWVSGTVGDAVLGLEVAGGRHGTLGGSQREALTRRYRCPEPRLALGRALLGLATACIDISDGLIADLGHVCDCSGVGARLSARTVPVSDAARAVLGSDAAALGRMLTGGDDYELLFTAGEAREGDIRKLAETLALPLTRIGTVTPSRGIEIEDADGLDLDLTRGGYRHFP